VARCPFRRRVNPDGNPDDVGETSTTLEVGVNKRRAALLPVAAIGVLLAAAPASASVTASWKTPTDSTTFTSNDPIAFQVSLAHSTLDSSKVSLSISVPGPQAGPYVVASTTGSSLSWTFTPACPNHSGGCPTGSAPAYNGRYTASLSGGTTGTRTVYLQVPPAAPTGVAATATAQHRVKVTWAANKEPDLTGYDVFASDGTVVVENLPIDTLSYEFDLPDSGYGGEHGYVVRAHRLACANCPDNSAQLDSPLSQPGTVTLTEPTPEPQPSDDGGSGGTSTGGGDNTGNGGYGNDGTTSSGGTSTGGNSSGGGTTQPSGNGYDDAGNTSGSFSSGSKPAAAVAQQRAAFGLTFKNFAPKLGAPKLPPLPQFAPQPLPEGTYDPLLNYGDDKEPGGGAAVASGPSLTTSVVETFTEAFQGARLFRSIAIALLLLLAAGHLRLWLRQEPHH
jgi:hypothetical protein